MHLVLMGGLGSAIHRRETTPEELVLYQTRHHLLHSALIQGNEGSRYRV